MSDPLRSFQVSNPVEWGKLVKSWSTGRNYFDETQPAPRLPRSLEELMAQCTKYRCGATVADRIKDIAIMTCGPATLGLRIPPASLIEKSEAAFKLANTVEPGNAQPDPNLAPGDYPLPDFYANFLKLKPTERDLKTMLDFHHRRVGEYTVNSCM